MIDGLPAEEELPAHRMTPIVKALLVAVALTVLLLAAFYVQSTRRADRLDRQAETLEESLAARADVIDELAAGQDAMRAQLEEADIEPAVPDPEVTIREVIRETGATGATGATGEQGLAGRDGRDGITPACWFEESQCVGPQGPAGEDGADGVDGQDGADSTVPGPQGPQGPSGADGAPGPACPPGYEPRVMETGPYQGWIACAPVG